MTITFTAPEQDEQLKPRIMVIGVGGAGGNAVNNMISKQLAGVDFVVANTDAQALMQSTAERRVQLGRTLTHGLGAGARPDMGRAAAEEAIDDINEFLQGTHMLFIAAGMGGGTGTGAAPVIARAAKEKGIIVTNTPDALSDATAEIAILLLLGAARRAGEGEALVRAQAWKEWSPSFMVGVQVTGKRLGIVGMGRVGQVVARRAKCFGMEIHYHNRSRLAPDLEDGAVFHHSLEDMLPLCQFLSLNCPHTPETAGLLNADVISQLPDGAVVINTARGSVVDDDALIEALSSGKLAAAGLDVFNNEPNIHPGYRQLKNTFLLPHIGSATAETRDAMGFRALNNLDAFFDGSEPGDRVA